MIGTRLAEMLIDAGYEVAVLSRSAHPERIRSFHWDPRHETIDETAVPYADYIINLAGASVSGAKWTDERKKDIMESRLQSTNLLVRELKKANHHVRALLSASAIGIYGDSGSQFVNEETPPAIPEDFLADVSYQWELAAEQVLPLDVRLVIIRIGIVLSAEGGALPAIAKPTKLGAGAPLGSGKQYMSWVHIDDLCRLFIQALEEDSWRGTYNGVAPNPVTNKEFTEILADVLHRPLVLPKVPAFGLKWVMGEMSEIVLDSQRVSDEKVLAKGFTFEFPTLEPALTAIYQHEE